MKKLLGNVRIALWRLPALLLLTTSLPTIAVTTAKPAVPFVNPLLAASTFPLTHMASDFTPTAGPVGPGRRLRKDEIRWAPIGPINGWAPIYSGPYPNGKRVIWVGGFDRIAKLDADTLEVLTTYAIGGTTYFGEEEIKRDIKTMDGLDDKGFVAYTSKLMLEPFYNALSIYRMLSLENEFYVTYHAPDGSISLRVYGEVDPADPASKIKLRREWKFPPDAAHGAVMSVTMTTDGTVVMVTQDGTMVALSKDFSRQDILKLPTQRDETKNVDPVSSFVRNALTPDNHNGLFVVTRDAMRRVQWTGTKLSIDEADGAWSAPYPNEKWIGSGTSPALMGWAPGEDHLVVVADGSKSNNMLAFWRDEIPVDWKGIPGYDRRVAGVTPIHFGVAKDEVVQVENALVVYGYGAFINNTYPEQRQPDQGTPFRQWLTESLYMHVPGHEAKGGAMIRWDQQTRTLKTAWQSQTNFTSTVCTVSGATEILYCWGARNREWTLEGTDWNTGKAAFTYTLGKSQRFNPLGAFVVIAPNGAVDCGCHGGLGIVRVSPKGGTKRTTAVPTKAH